MFVNILPDNLCMLTVYKFFLTTSKIKKVIIYLKIRMAAVTVHKSPLGRFLLIPAHGTLFVATLLIGFFSAGLSHRNQSH